MTKTYCVFTVNGVDQLGSDAYYRLDGRENLATQIAHCKKRMHTLRNVKPDYNGFRIFKCQSLLDKGITTYVSENI